MGRGCTRHLRESNKSLRSFFQFRSSFEGLRWCTQCFFFVWSCKRRDTRHGLGQSFLHCLRWAFCQTPPVFREGLNDPAFRSAQTGWRAAEKNRWTNSPLFAWLGNIGIVYLQPINRKKLVFSPGKETVSEIKCLLSLLIFSCRAKVQEIRS